MIDEYERVDVFIGVDVGKGEHHAIALDRAGKQLFDRALPNAEAQLRELITGIPSTMWPSHGGRSLSGGAQPRRQWC